MAVCARALVRIISSLAAVATWQGDEFVAAHTHAHTCKATRALTQCATFTRRPNCGRTTRTKAPAGYLRLYRRVHARARACVRNSIQLIVLRVDLLFCTQLTSTPFETIQLQGQHALDVQALAAAMLPLFWPSFQLGVASTATLAAQRKQHNASLPMSTTPSLVDLATTSSPVAEYTQFPRSRGGAAGNALPSAASYTFAEPARAPSRRRRLDSASERQPSLATGKVDIDNNDEEVAARKPARKKPNYLMQAPPVTPYPDSTRLASKYAMPKIKFQVAGAHRAPLPQQLLTTTPTTSNHQAKQKEITTTTITTTTAHPALASRSTTTTPKKAAKQLQANEQRNEAVAQVHAHNKATTIQQHIPKSLSKLIEHQLLVNATNLLRVHKHLLGSISTKRQQQQQQSSQNAVNLTSLFSQAPAPTTSVSKVVRLRNDSDAHIPLGAPANFPRDLTRHLAPVPAIASASVAQSLHALASTTTAKPAITTTTTTTLQPTTTTTTTTSARPKTTTEQPVTTLLVDAVAPITSTQRPSRPQRARAATTTTTTSSTTTTTTTTAAPSAAVSQPTVGALDELDEAEETGEPASSNKVVPEDEHTPAPKRTGAGRKRDKAVSPFAGARAAPRAGGARSSSNIKLFQFKRKPDTNKLPFYKKPLNYTDLGWSAEQIAEHQASVAALLGTSEEQDAEQQQQDDEDDKKQQQQASSNTKKKNVDSHAMDAATAPLLKRKRRGKSQFDKLMAELHGEKSAPSSPRGATPPTQRDGQSGDNQQDDTSVGEDGAEESEQSSEQEAKVEVRVPVLKAKSEPLVMKPMIFVVGAKRRAAAAAAAAAAASADTAATTTTTTTRAPVVDEQPAASNKSKPIIRMRRKHHGELPGLPGGWRPQHVQPLPTTQVVAGERLLLVPSALLTPSGTHLVPLYAPGGPSPRPAAAAAAAITSETQNAWQPSAPAAVAPEPTAASELRVPKLLSKPMRPAKYSLNGYIPKPSLAQQQQQAAQTQLAQQQQQQQQPLLQQPQQQTHHTSAVVLSGLQQATSGASSSPSTTTLHSKQNHLPAASSTARQSHIAKQPKQMQQPTARAETNAPNRDLVSSLSVSLCVH